MIYCLIFNLFAAMLNFAMWAAYGSPSSAACGLFSAIMVIICLNEMENE